LDGLFCNSRRGQIPRQENGVGPERGQLAFRPPRKCERITAEGKFDSQRGTDAARSTRDKYFVHSETTTATRHRIPVFLHMR